MNCTRREVVGGLTLAGSAGLFGIWSDTVSAEPPPETTTIKIGRAPSLCQAPQYLAGPLLMTEGFTKVQYVEVAASHEAFGPGKANIAMSFVAPLLLKIEAGEPVVV